MNDIEAKIDQEIARRPHLTRAGRKRVRRLTRRRLLGADKTQVRTGRLLPFRKFWDDDKARHGRANRGISYKPRRDTPKYLRETRQTFWPPFSRPLSPHGVELLGHPPRPRKRR